MLPVVGVMLVILGGGTVKFTPLLATPPTVTTTSPLAAAAGTGTTMLVSFQLVGDAMVPLKVTVLAPWVGPKFVPVMVTGVPALPAVGVMFVILTIAVKFTPLLATPFTVTTTFPLVAAAGI
jgi:hypothetical protein